MPNVYRKDHFVGKLLSGQPNWRTWPNALTRPLSDRCQMRLRKWNLFNVNKSCYINVSDRLRRHRRTYRSVVFARWRQCEHPSNVWFFVSKRVCSNGILIGLSVFARLTGVPSTHGQEAAPPRHSCCAMGRVYEWVSGNWKHLETNVIGRFLSNIVYCWYKQMFCHNAVHFCAR